MDFAYSARTRDLQQKVAAFMEAHVYPAEKPFADEVAANRAAGNPWQATKVMVARCRSHRARAGGPPMPATRPRSHSGAAASRPRCG